ncbi:IS1182 family transposase [Mucilaginibacter gynuensis]|uniref:IS1182 family transposase n=1 Tax=Mucilaginibacter gynuensis TaxID=1302236 RepID=A0ABP8HP04_9SPHI
MQGKKSHQEKLFISFQLSNRVPGDNFYRRLAQELDLRFLYRLTAPYYGTEGQKSIDPVVFFKLMLAGYLENLNSDRRIISAFSLRLDILYFIGYDVDEELPWHSTLSRTRQLYGEHVFTELFRRVLKQCCDKGMVSGRRQAVDGFFIKANASLDSLIEKEILKDGGLYGQELKANEEHDTAMVKPLKDHDDQDVIKPKNKPSNDTHYSPSDPDAKMSVKPGKATALNFLGQVAVDTTSHVITHVQAVTADKRDSECLPSVLRHVKHNLLGNGLLLSEIIADKGYSSADALKALQASGVTGYIPNRGQFNYQREGFIHDPLKDSFQCGNGSYLVHKQTTLTAGYWMKEYRVSRKECNTCALKDTCSAYGKNITRIVETLDKPYYDVMHIRMQTRKAKRMMKIRQGAVEPVIGTLVNYLGIKRVNSKGVEQANKCLTMAAIAYNIKKMLKNKGKYLKSELKVFAQIFFTLFNSMHPSTTF